MTSPDPAVEPVRAPSEVDEDEPTDDAAHAPPVVVAVVAHEPGDWFEETLASLAAQDYPNLSVLVLDTGAGDALISRVADVLPTAYVRAVEGNPGFSRAANEVLGVVEGAAFYCFCHDDVALDPSAIRNLVEEALRSNAGIVGPKLVEWDDPNRLLEVGLVADKTGVVAPIVERGELDQEQHDAIRDVFLVPTACVLIRSDLFRVLEGFDPVIEVHGEDLDLCWRAQVAGARVVVVPEARVRHRARMEERRDTEDAVRLRARHRLRTVLTCYGRFHLVRVVPQGFLFMLGEVTLAIVTGRFGQAKDLASAWSWNLRRLSELRARRAALKRVRTFPDSEVRRLQARGSARLNRFVRGEFGSADRVRESLVGVGRGITDTFTSGSQRFVVGAWLLVAVVVFVGSRSLIADRIPVVSGFAPITSGPFDLLRDYLSGWHRAGLDGDAPVPTAIALLGLAGIPVFGQLGFLQLLLVVGMLPVGAIGVWRLTKPLVFSRARAAGLVLYIVNPLPYDALERGSWAGLLLYGATPWVLARLLRAAGDDPFSPPDDWVRAVAGYGILMALVTALVPIAAPLFVVVALALVIGSLLVGSARAALGALGLSAAGVVVAALLHLPWTLDFVLPGSDWWAIGGVSPMGTDRVAMADLLRFQVGSVGFPLLGWAVPLAAVLPLLIGQEWRFRLAVRGWVVALACWALAWSGSNGMLPFDVPAPHVVLAPAAAALALNAALGILAFDVDLRGYRFGLRQVASIASAGLVIAAVFPVLVASLDGRWNAPRLDLGRALAFLDDEQIGGSRTLWIGDPDVLPLAGHRLTDDLAYALSDDGVPDAVDRIATSAQGTELVADALRTVADGRSDRLGRLLAPFGIRHVVLLSSSAPARANGVDEDLPAGVAATIARQLDLKRIDVDPAIELYENTAWMPVRSRVRGPGADALDSTRLFSTAAGTDFSRSVPAVGNVDAGPVHLGVPYSSGWHLSVDGVDVPHSKSLGWANRFDVERGGVAKLRYETPPARWLAVLAQLLLWFIVIQLVRRRRRSDAELEPVIPLAPSEPVVAAVEVDA